VTWPQSLLCPANIAVDRRPPGQVGGGLMDLARPDESSRNVVRRRAAKSGVAALRTWVDRRVWRKEKEFALETGQVRVQMDGRYLIL
jgi:hypothetical protein